VQKKFQLLATKAGSTTRPSFFQEQMEHTTIPLPQAEIKLINYFCSIQRCARVTRYLHILLTYYQGSSIELLARKKRSTFWIIRKHYAQTSSIVNTYANCNSVNFLIAGQRTADSW